MKKVCTAEFVGIRFENSVRILPVVIHLGKLEKDFAAGGRAILGRVRSTSFGAACPFLIFCPHSHGDCA
jgi:hypothetical protein